MKADPTRSADDELGASAVLYLAGEGDAEGRGGFEAAMCGDAAARSMLAELRGVDAALRVAADADSPSLAELRRTRDASLRFARTRGAALVAMAASRGPARTRRIPRWSIAAAAAVLAVAGVVGWVGSPAPIALPAKDLSSDVSFAQKDPFEQWVQDWRDYRDLVPAFSPVDARPADGGAATPDSLDDGDSEVDALTMLSTMSQD